MQINLPFGMEGIGRGTRRNGTPRSPGPVLRSSDGDVGESLAAEVWDFGRSIPLKEQAEVESGPTWRGTPLPGHPDYQPGSTYHADLQQYNRQIEDRKPSFLKEFESRHKHNAAPACLRFHPTDIKWAKLCSNPECPRHGLLVRQLVLKHMWKVCYNRCRL